MPPPDTVVVAIALGALAYFLYKRVKSQAGPYANLPLPPGPKGLPLIGNLRDMPTSREWITYHRWAKEHNTDILYLNVAGTNIIVLDTYDAVIDLLEKRSSIYSNRPHSTMIMELMGFTFALAFIDYGKEWRRHRRLIHDSFHPTAALRFRPFSTKATRNLLNRFLDVPDDIMENLRHMAGETIMSLTYGIDVQDFDDPYIAAAQRGGSGGAIAGVPGTFLVDSLPILKYIPEWVPGAQFQRKAKEWKEDARQMIELPYAATMEKLAAGTCPPCFVSLNLEKMEDISESNDAYQERIIKSSAGSLYIAGVDTTSSAIASCILGFLERPEVLLKAQEEIDRVIKPGHLPDFDDQDSLPYITAITKEALRWRDVIPLAAPHRLAVEDEYKGYRIPAGSIVIPNAWAILHDEQIYTDPFTFNPDRFMKNGKLDPSVPDPSRACWGFGRRTCPGRYFAHSAVWIAIASIVAVFDIDKARDENGHVIGLTHEYESGMVHTPKPYNCSIKPRSPEAERVIRAHAHQASDNGVAQ